MKNLHASLHLLCVYQIIMDQVLTLWFIGCAVSCDCYIFVRILWDTVSNCSLLPSVCKAIHNFLSFDFWQIYNFSSFHSQKLSKCLSFYLLKKVFLYKYLKNSREILNLLSWTPQSVDSHLGIWAQWLCKWHKMGLQFAMTGFVLYSWILFSIDLI